MTDFFRGNSYTILAIGGGIITFIVYLLLGRRRDVSWKQALTLFIIAMLGLLAGSHLLFFLVNLPEWIADYAPDIHTLADFFVAFAYGASGLVFYGGLFGAYIIVLLVCRISHLYIHSELNHMSAVIPLFHAFGRIGCTINGCCYGIEYHGLFAIQYSAANINPGVTDDIADFPRFPVQPLEALIELLIFALLLILYIKTRDKYSLTCIYLLIYSVIRFLDEFLRGDAARKIWGPFSTSQWISLAVFAGVVITLIVRRIRHPEKGFFSFY